MDKENQLGNEKTSVFTFVGMYEEQKDIFSVAKNLMSKPIQNVQ